MPFGSIDYCYMGCHGKWLCDVFYLRSDKALLPVASYVDQQIASTTFVVTITTVPMIEINHVIITTKTPIHYKTLHAKHVESLDDEHCTDKTLHAKLVESLDDEHCTDKQDDSNSPQI